MTTLEDLYCKAKSVAEAAGKKTEELVEFTKLKFAAAETERDLTASFEALGRLVYDAKESGTEDTEMLEACLAQIKEQKTFLSDLRAAMDEYKKGTRCLACGIVNDEDSVYCKKCGKPLA